MADTPGHSIGLLRRSVATNEQIGAARAQACWLRRARSDNSRRATGAGVSAEASEEAAPASEPFSLPSVQASVSSMPPWKIFRCAELRSRIA